MMTLNPEQAHEDEGQAEKWIGAALRGPLDAFGLAYGAPVIPIPGPRRTSGTFEIGEPLRDSAKLDEDEFGEYVMFMLPALFKLAGQMRELPDRSRGGTKVSKRKKPKKSTKPKR